MRKLKLKNVSSYEKQNSRLTKTVKTFSTVKSDFNLYSNNSGQAETAGNKRKQERVLQTRAKGADRTRRKH